MLSLLLRFRAAARPHRVHRCVLPGVLFAFGATLSAQARAYTGPAFTRTEVAPGVHAFVFDNPLGDGANVDGTSVVIINDADVVVVDAQWTPATTRRVIAEIRALTALPVRYVITTHWHGDHWFGNSAYRDAWPGVEFVSHVNTRTDQVSGELNGGKGVSVVEETQSVITQLADRLAKGKRRDGSPLTAADSTILIRQLAGFRWALPATREVQPIQPTMTVADSLVLHRGNRDIVVRYLGRGNTRGDLSVWLPKEQVLITGDLLVNPAPYSFGSFPGEWQATLGKLRALPAAVIVPGHGAIQRDWRYLDLFVELLAYTRAGAAAAVARGLDLDATRRAVDLSGFRARFAKGDERVGRAFDAFFIAPAVERAWLEARGELDKR